MSNHPAPRAGVPGPDDAAHEDGQLMHELSEINAHVSYYILRFLDADARRTTPMSIEDERALADRLTSAARSLHTRASRRERAWTPQPEQADRTGPRHALRPTIEGD